MSISTEAEMEAMQRISEVVAITLKMMREYAQPGMSTKELDEYGGSILKQYGARSAPNLAYKFPGYTCICVNNEVAHGIPKAGTILKEGDLVNVDVSAELDGYWSDNGGSFVLGNDLFRHKRLVEASKEILQKAIYSVRDGFRISEMGRIIETEARKRGYTVIRNLLGHGIGRSLHEAPKEIPNYYDKFNRAKFHNNSVVAIETFISTRATHAYETNDGWTLKTNDGSFVAQHEHTIVVTKGEPIILTSSNGIWDR
jgi:methionyl aminopeptidase